MRMQRFIVTGLGFAGLILIISLYFLSMADLDPRSSGSVAVKPRIPGAYALRYWERGQRTPHKFKWQRAPSDKYLLWKSWHAGFNNERISLELAFAFALLWNRTLVLPPAYTHYNLKTFRYEDFYEIDDMQQIIPVLTYEQFQAKEGFGDDYANVRSAGAKVLEWKEISKAESIFVFPEKPTPEDSEKFKRMQRFATKKRTLIRDNNDVPGLHDAKYLYFPERMLFSHFYLYIHCVDPAVDQFMKRSIRDYVHFKTEIFDVAKMVLDALPRNFSAIHIRRDDFQYPNQRHLQGPQVFQNVQDLIPEGSQLYIATDEKNKEAFRKEFVDVFQKRYNVHMLDDYFHLIKKHVKSNWVGVIEQIILSRSQIFVGTKLSTFSGYVTRMRGYMKDIADTTIYFTDTLYPSGYGDSNVFPTEWPTWNDYWIYHAFWGKEFSESWENIDEQ